MLQLFKNGKKTVTTSGTAVPLSSTAVYAHNLIVKAAASNTGLIYIGTSAVGATNGFQLSAGDQLNLKDLLPENQDFTVDLNKIYVDAAVNAEYVTFCYLDRA